MSWCKITILRMVWHHMRGFKVFQTHDIILKFWTRSCGYYKTSDWVHKLWSSKFSFRWYLNHLKWALGSKNMKATNISWTHQWSNQWLSTSKPISGPIDGSLHYTRQKAQPPIELEPLVANHTIIDRGYSAVELPKNPFVTPIVAMLT